MLIDFDKIADWEAGLTDALNHVVTDQIIEKIRRTKFEYIEDARDLLFILVNKDLIIDVTINWLSSNNLAAYHGTKLIDSEIESIKRNGLLPLDSIHRITRLQRTLSSHPKWSEISEQLIEEIKNHGERNSAGKREGQVHLTLSRSGLINGFNHYLIFGSEFDLHVALTLLGQEGKQLLANDGKSIIIKLSIPGRLALNAAHPYFSINDVRKRGDVPNIIEHFLKVWSYRLAFPDFQVSNLEVDCGMIFNRVVPANWILDIEIIQE